jgi:hypothetical protein
VTVTSLFLLPDPATGFLDDHLRGSCSMWSTRSTMGPLSDMAARPLHNCLIKVNRRRRAG